MPLDAHVRTVEQLFEQNRFRIPPYQRDYVWERIQLADLMDDIFEAMDEVAGDARAHVIGNITTCRADDNVLEVIDGQQRLTTLFLVLCGIRDVFAALGADDKEISNVEGLLSSRPGLHLTAARTQTGRLLSDIFKGQTENLTRRKRASKHTPLEVKNISNNFLDVRDMLSRRAVGRDYADLGEVEEGVLQRAALRKVDNLYTFLIRNVHAVLFQADNPELAIRVFQGANTRGLSLGQMDLLKTEILARVIDNRDYLNQWDAIMQEVDGKADAFLRYHIALEYGVFTSKSKIYRWYRDAARTNLVDLSDVDHILTRMHRNARLYACFLAHRGPNDRPVEALTRISLMGANKRQHILLLMAAAHLDNIDPRLFDRFCAEVERLVFVSLVADEEPKEEEKRFSEWAQRLRFVTSAPDLDMVLAETLQRRRHTKRDEFLRNVVEMRATDSEGLPCSTAKVPQRMRYALASIARHLEIEGQASKHATLDTFLDMELEHILPQDPKSAPARAFIAGFASDGEERYHEHASWIANMTWLTKGRNGSAGAGSFASKTPHYLGSGVVMNTLLVPGVYSSASRMGRLSAAHPAFSSWLPADIARRADDLKSWSEAVWILPV
jgi:hypothetical protein